MIWFTKAITVSLWLLAQNSPGLQGATAHSWLHLSRAWAAAHASQPSPRSVPSHHVWGPHLLLACRSLVHFFHTCFVTNNFVMNYQVFTEGDGWKRGIGGCIAISHSSLPDLWKLPLQPCFTSIAQCTPHSTEPLWEPLSCFLWEQQKPSPPVNAPAELLASR